MLAPRKEFLDVQANSGWRFTRMWHGKNIIFGWALTEYSQWFQNKVERLLDQETEVRKVELKAITIIKTMAISSWCARNVSFAKSNSIVSSWDWYFGKMSVFPLMLIVINTWGFVDRHSGRQWIYWWSHFFIIFQSRQGEWPP